MECQGPRKYSILLWHAHLDPKTKPAQTPWPAFSFTYGLMHAGAIDDIARAHTQTHKNTRMKEKSGGGGTLMIMHHLWYSQIWYCPTHAFNYSALYGGNLADFHPQCSYLQYARIPQKPDLSRTRHSHVRFRCDQNKIRASVHHSFAAPTLCNDWLGALARIEY